MELRHLHYFIAVAEELHFGRAARNLGIAQPALSQQIRKLEEELGVLLLERRTRRDVKLTDAGRAMLREARATVAQAEQTILATQRASRGQEGQLNVGLVGSVAFDIFPVILKTHLTRFPEVQLALRELTSGEQIEALRQERIQVGFLRPREELPELQVETLLEEPLIAALPEGHRLSSRLQIELAELANDPFVLTPGTGGCGTILEVTLAACERAGFRPRRAQEATQLGTVVSLVAGGLGVALLPASIQNLQRRGAVYRRLAPPVPRIPLALVHRRGDSSPIVQAFLATAREAVRQMTDAAAKAG